MLYVCKPASHVGNLEAHVFEPFNRSEAYQPTVSQNNHCVAFTNSFFQIGRKLASVDLGIKTTASKITPKKGSTKVKGVTSSTGEHVEPEMAIQVGK